MHVQVYIKAAEGADVCLVEPGLHTGRMEMVLAAQENYFISKLVHSHTDRAFFVFGAFDHLLSGYLLKGSLLDTV